ncbi:MAG: FtsW/RodA/SpoVE family cell cycle protein [Bacteroidales bacterium]|nr:FtsW/RodA/SpoVE family cell cycle protein [Bacteroidales bacterium]
MRRKLNILAGDKALWVIFLLLSVISLVAVYSTIGLSAISDLNSTPMRIFCRHLGFVVAAALIAIFVSHLKYRYFARASVILLYLSVAALVVVIIMGTKRWLVIPHVVRFEPSELAKIALIVYLARCIALRRESLDEPATFRRLLYPILIVCLLVTPANLSTGILIFLTCYIMLFFGGVNRRLWWRGLLLLLGISLVGFLILYFFGNQIQIGRVPTWAHRFQSWIHPNPDELTQENMARMAVARGGFWGNGIGTTIHGRLMTQAHNDFILAIIIEEAGLISAIAIFALYAWFYFRCIRIATACRGLFGSLIVAGTGTLIFLQAVINISVAVGLLPVTGQTLPFISYGGTAYLCLGLGLGIIQAVAFRNKKLNRKAATAQQVSAEPESTVSDTENTQQLN